MRDGESGNPRLVHLIVKTSYYMNPRIILIQRITPYLVSNTLLNGLFHRDVGVSFECNADFLRQEIFPSFHQPERVALILMQVCNAAAQLVLRTQQT